MISFETIWEENKDAVNSLAAEMGRKGHDWGAETGDFSQEFALWMLDNEDKMVEVAEDETTTPETFTRWLLKCLRNEGLDYLVDIRGQATGQERQDAYWYTRGELEQLLDSVFNDDAWTEPPVSEGRSTKAPAHGGNWITTLADVSRAFDRLSAGDQMLLREFHEEGLTNGDLANRFDVSEAVMSYRHGAAITRLLKILGGPRPNPMRPGDSRDPWRGRHAVSNEVARRAQKSQF